jgi:site-specific DNA-methyltransferase (adenine-specific)
MQAWHSIWAIEALRIIKPGGHLVAFGGTRTFHRLTCALEDAGFEIRDCLMWLYGQGFPKSKNLRGDHEGWGTAFKPAWEPIILARKPLKGTVAENMQKYGTGALNIKGCRIEGAVNSNPLVRNAPGFRTESLIQGATGKDRISVDRWPANVILDEDAADMLDEQSGSRTSGRLEPHHYRGQQRFQNTYGNCSGGERATDKSFGGDSGGASRFFYCAKASRAERNADNHHPTVKPVNLMRWLCRLVTPPGGLVLDPFTGSGSTGIGAIAEGFRFIGIELSPEYCAMASARITALAPLFLGKEQG